MAGINRERALELAHTHGLRVFVETGTWKGATAIWACDHFDFVHTIEGLENRWKKTLDYYRRHPELNRDNIEWWHGDSIYVLPEILSRLQQPALFWLDAHYCGTNDEECDAGLTVCPLLAEIAAINAHEYAAQHVILIDDARLFGMETGWPSLKAIQRKLGGFSREIRLSEDVLYAVPKVELMTYDQHH